MTSFTIVCLALLVWLSGCKKTCYQCSALVGSFRCYKGNDTVLFGAVDLSAISDSLMEFYSKGFACDTTSFSWFQGGGPGTAPVCNKEMVQQFEQAGDDCVASP